MFYTRTPAVSRTDRASNGAVIFVVKEEGHSKSLLVTIGEYTCDFPVVVHCESQTDAENKLHK